MLNQLFIFMPCAICAFWALIYILIAPRSRTYRMVVFYLAMATVYFFTDACYECAMTSPQLLVITSIIAQLIGPMMLPMAIMYLAELAETRRRISAIYVMWVILPVMVFCIELVFMFLAGPSNAADFIEKAYNVYPVPGYTGLEYQFLYTLMVYVYRILLAIGATAFISYIIASCIRHKYSLAGMRDFIFRGGSVSSAHLEIFNFTMLLIVSIAKISLLREFYIGHQFVATVFSIITAAIICQICSSGLFAGRDKVSIDTMWDALRNNVSGVVPSAEPKLSVEVTEPSQVAGRIEAQPESTPAEEQPVQVTGIDDFQNSDEYRNAKAAIESALLGQKMYLTQGITIQDVAAKAGIDRSTAARVFPLAYGVQFNDYIGALRIADAKQYILTHPADTQEQIAKACGFPSASSFNNTFKKITGMTPRIWTATQGH